MSASPPQIHQAIAQAAVKAIFGESAVVREMVEITETHPLKLHISAFESGVRAFWNHWTGRHPHGSTARDEAQN